eukprot:TRINITY_DN85_c0_g1_i1.p1 TRINITY_DN85_c0_g1~~TRINITY_DN85_c0_g1_i1.p1  ORF type:complete len:376 (-),score=31.38 TRINITY_DN85_c0_g1_i1:1376-2503(-)
MLTELARSEEVQHILSLYSKSEWDRIVKALIAYGARQLLYNYDLRDVTVRQIENIAFGSDEEVRASLSKASYQSRPDYYESSNNRPEELKAPSLVEFEAESRKEPEGFELLAKEIQDIKKKLVNLDNKVTGKFVRGGEKEVVQESTKGKRNKKREGYRALIYPSWWASSTSTHRSQQVREDQKWADTEWRKKHELDCTELARECLKQNRIASTRRPVKMVFDKKEFSGPYIYREPHPKIVAKRVAGVPFGVPLSGGNSVAERNNQIRSQQEYYDQHSAESPSVPKMVEGCADSPIIKYFSNEYQGGDNQNEDYGAQRDVPEGAMSSGTISGSKSTESKAYYSSELPHEASKDDELGLHAGSRKTTGAYNYPLQVH